MNAEQQLVNPPSRMERFFRRGWISSKPFEVIGIALIVALSLIPVVNLMHILLTTGANNLSNDYAQVMPVIDKILSGKYVWSNIFRDAFYASHFQLLPLAIYLCSAVLFGWNVGYELGIVFFLSILRIF